MKHSKAFGNIVLLLTSVIWGVAFVFQRTGMDAVEPITFNAARMASGAAFLIALSAIFDIKNQKNKITSAKVDPESAKARKRATVIGGILCGFFLTASSTVQQMGIVHTSAGKAGFITAMYMLLVPIFNLILFKKKTGKAVWIACGLGLVGMYLLCVTESFTLTSGDALILLCAVLFSGHILCCDRFAPLCDPVKLSAIQFSVAAVSCTVLALIFEKPTLEGIVTAAVPILYCGIMSGGVGYTLQIVGQKHTEPATASLIMSLESVFAVVAGVLMLGERMTRREFFGCVIMFAAIILVQLPDLKIKKQKETQ